MSKLDVRTAARPLALTFTIVLAAFACACGGGDGGSAGRAAAPEPASEAAPAATVDAEAARAIYAEQDCAMCHGEDRAGTDMAPPLRDLGTYWNEDMLVRYLDDPLVFQEEEPSFRENRKQYDLEMPAYGNVPVEQRRTLARWLLQD